MTIEHLPEFCESLIRQRLSPAGYIALEHFSKQARTLGDCAFLGLNAGTKELYADGLIDTEDSTTFAITKTGLDLFEKITAPFKP